MKYKIAALLVAIFCMGALTPTPSQGASIVVQIGDRIEVAGRLLPAEAAIQVGADGDVPGIAGDLADMIDMPGDGRDVACQFFWGRLATHPSGNDHPGIKGRTDDGSAFQQCTDVCAGLAGVGLGVWVGAGVGVGAGPLDTT